MNIGDKVYVIRERHGWHDGNLICEIIEKHKRSTGTHWYFVRDSNGNEYEVKHSRDMRLVES